MRVWWVAVLMRMFGLFVYVARMSRTLVDVENPSMFEQVEVHRTPSREDGL